MNTRSISRSIGRVVFLALAAILLLSGVAVAQFGLPALERWVMGAGGGTAETGTIRLDGTLGQPIVGQSGDEKVALSAGFWTVPGETSYPLYLPLVTRLP